MPLSTLRIKERSGRNSRVLARTMSVPQLDQENPTAPTTMKMEVSGQQQPRRFRKSRDSMHLLCHPEVPKLQDGEMDDEEGVLNDYLSSFVSMMDGETQESSGNAGNFQTCDLMKAKVSRIENDSSRSHKTLPLGSMYSSPTSSSSSPLKGCLKRSKDNTVAKRRFMRFSGRTASCSDLSNALPSREMPRSTSARCIMGRVNFSVVQIREYAVEIGDNPSCKSGTPLTIGWSYHQSYSTTVVEYETLRPPRRTHKNLYLSRSARRKRLLEHGCTNEEIAMAAKQAAKDRNLRTETASNMKFYYYELSKESARRKMMRLLKLRKKDGEMIENLWLEANGPLISTSNAEGNARAA